jgi:hypothetical protein
MTHRVRERQAREEETKFFDKAPYEQVDPSQKGAAALTRRCVIMREVSS